MGRQSAICQCGQPAANGAGYCNPCKATYMRAWRKANPMTPEQAVKDNARSYANVYRRRGALTPEPCEDCGNPEVVMHHDDYSKPLQVNWLCQEHHEALHLNESPLIAAVREAKVREMVRRKKRGLSPYK